MRTFGARPALPERESGVALAVRRARGAALGAMRVQRLRLDKWLWYARFYKSRTLASGACATGRMRVNGVPIAKAHQAVKAGDVLTFPQ
ncbi:MAG: S4 domain-containing protein, partial [Rhodoplanes sp.]